MTDPRVRWLGLAVRRQAGKRSCGFDCPLRLSLLFKTCDLWTPFFDFALTIDKTLKMALIDVIVQELCESRGGRPGLSVLTSLLVSDVKIY